MLRQSLRCLLLAVPLFIFSCDKKQAPPDGFQIEPGFDLALVASEPLIKDPVDLEFNEKGEALVLEMPGYPFEDSQSRIVILNDKNDDGVYDDSHVFAENLQMGASILPYKDGVLVAAPPYLLFVKDTDQDNKADAVDTLMGGFSTGNLQHNYNGLTYGMDNWIYAANGGNSGKPYWWGDPSSATDMRGQDLRFDPERRIMERIGASSGGFGLGMDEYGRIFETHNLNHISHLIFPERYQKDTRLMIDHSLKNISDHEENGLARIYPIGEQESRVNHPEQSGYFSGSCGITYYGGNAFGPEYENTVWVADVVLNLVHVDKIKPDGAALTATRLLQQKDFLASTDRSFRPVNMAVGPDGAVYVVDMYRKVIEHPEWIPDEIEKGLDLNAGKDKGRIYRITKSNTRPARFDFKSLESAEGLIGNLSSNNQWIRKTSHRLLMDRELNDEGIRKLGDLLSAESAFGRLHAMWILSLKGKLTEAQLLKALDDATPGVRENALMVAEKSLSSSDALLKKCLAMCGDDDQRVRMQAALSVSVLPKEALQRNQEGIVSALVGAAKKPADEWNDAAMTLAAKEASVELFDRLVAAGNRSESLLESLAMVSSQTPEGLALILNTLATADLGASVREKLIRQLANVDLGKGGSALLRPIGALEQSGDIRLLSACASLRNTLKLPPSSGYLRLSRNSLTAAVNRSLPDSVRLQHLEMIALLPYKEKSEVLFKCLDNTEPVKVQEAAIRQLADYAEPAIGYRLVEKWPELGPQIRRYAGDLLLYHEIHHDALLTGLEKGIINIGEMNFDLERRRTLLWWTNNENTKRRAEALFSDAGVVNRKEAIDKMKPALTLAGSPQNGEKIFTTICGNCHMYGSIGHSVGPVLTEISRKSKELLLSDILDPNAAVNTQYINHRVETKSGEIHMGVVDSETDQYITIKKMGGEKVTINKSDVKKFSSLGTSLMMEGLEGSMSQQEMADLLAFLQEGNSGTVGK
ncbi:MAG TPA: PVC-type heme-binding CxxCH protein [Chryseosolibacter sp.]